MPEIVPAIIAENFKELEEKTRLVEPYVKTVQLDVADGIFVANKTWPYFAPQSGATNGKPFVADTPQGKPSLRDLDKIETTLDFEAHLMIDSPHQVLNEWLNSRVKRVILHWEVLEKIHNHELLPYKTQITAGFPVSNLAEEAHQRGKEFGVALNLETPVAALDNFMSYVDLVLLMSVPPGWGGQRFDERVIPKIIALRQKYPDVKIEVDGGVSADNMAKLIEAGADFLAVGSAIFNAGDIGGMITELNDLAAKSIKLK